jgi:hypothetical protein
MIAMIAKRLNYLGPSQTDHLQGSGDLRSLGGVRCIRSWLLDLHKQHHDYKLP